MTWSSSTLLKSWKRAAFSIFSALLNRERSTVRPRRSANPSAVVGTPPVFALFVFAFLALGRALIRDPDFVDRLKRGEIDASRCDHCNKCMAEMERPTGTRCVYWPEGGPIVPSRRGDG